jgi:hypothetical protein
MRTGGAGILLALVLAGCATDDVAGRRESRDAVVERRRRETAEFFATNSAALTLEQAVGISVQVRSAMRLLPVLPRVFRCECTREYNFTDTRSKERRYQAVFEILYMEE